MGARVHATPGTVQCTVVHVQNMCCGRMFSSGKHRILPPPQLNLCFFSYGCYWARA